MVVIDEAIFWYLAGLELSIFTTLEDCFVSMSTKDLFISRNHIMGHDFREEVCETGVVLLFGSLISDDWKFLLEGNSTWGDTGFEEISTVRTGDRL